MKMVGAGFSQVAAEAEHQDCSAFGGSMMELNQESMGHSTTFSLLGMIPPERVGLNGEYDHRGLAKRVALTFRQQCLPAEIEKLRVTQRGAVVVMVGKIADQRLLIKLVNLAMATSGAADVEINGASVGYGLKAYLEVKPSREALKALQKVVAH